MSTDASKGLRVALAGPGGMKSAMLPLLMAMAAASDTLVVGKFTRGAPFVPDDDFDNYPHDRPTEHTGKLPERGANPHNLPEWDIDGIVVYAATRKAAIKKAKKSSL